jgi:TonB family protein
MKILSVAMIVAVCAVAGFGNQDPDELSATARERIKQAHASIVVVQSVDQANEKVSHALGFFVRNDLIATDSEILDRNSHPHVTAATKPSMVKVLSAGNYILPYVLVEAQTDITPLTLGESERVAVNDSVYMLSDSGEITTGKVTAITKIKNNPAFLISLPINSDNKGAPIFNRHGEVIGIAAKSQDGQSAGLVWPSELLATLKHLGEPGVGIGAGMGPGIRPVPAPTYTTPPATVVDSKPVRLSSPRPQYTEEARANQVSGTVMLRVQVDVDGNVSAVRVISGLPYGLTDQAIDVARHTKFKPAMKDGKPVAYWMGIEISFVIR